MTTNPAFAGSYTVGQAYRTKVPLHIMSIMEDRQDDVVSYVLWTDEAYRNYDEREPILGRECLMVSSIPAGAVIKVRRLEYYVDEYSFEPLCLFAMSHRIPELLAVGDLSSGSRRARLIAPVGSLLTKYDVVGPDGQNVWVIPPDPDVIEPIRPRTTAE